MTSWNWRKNLKIWSPPLLGVSAMLLLGYLFEVARFFLFAHHLFYIIGAFLLINPVTETFWPSPELKKEKRILPLSSAKARARAEARKLMEKQKLPSAQAAPAEHLARLLKEKEAVDQKIKKLTARDKEHVK